MYSILSIPPQETIEFLGVNLRGYRAHTMALASLLPVTVYTEHSEASYDPRASDEHRGGAAPFGHSLLCFSLPALKKHRFHHGLRAYTPGQPPRVQGAPGEAHLPAGSSQLPKAFWEDSKYSTLS